MFNPNHVYLLPNRGRLPLSLQIHLSGKSKVIFLLFYCSFGLSIKFAIFSTTTTTTTKELHSLSIIENINIERHGHLNAEIVFYLKNPLKWMYQWVPKTVLKVVPKLLTPKDVVA